MRAEAFMGGECVRSALEYDGRVPEHRSDSECGCRSEGRPRCRACLPGAEERVFFELGLDIYSIAYIIA